VARIGRRGEFFWGPLIQVCSENVGFAFVRGKVLQERVRWEGWVDFSARIGGRLVFIFRAGVLLLCWVCVWRARVLCG